MPNTGKLMVVFTAQDGSMWAFPGEVVAHKRATYYTKNDNSTTYQEEFDYVMGDARELRDWLMNNMNFCDFSQFIVQYRPAKHPDLEAAWDGGNGHDPNVVIKENDSTYEILFGSER